MRGDQLYGDDVAAALLCMLIDAGKFLLYFFFQAEVGIRDPLVTGVQTCALPISAFPLHWFRADRSIVAEDGALPGAGTATAALAALLAGDPGTGTAVASSARRDGDGSAFVPVHPWQARRLLERPEVRALLAAGLLADLGPQGAPWWPTSSLRTVYRADLPVML